MEFINRESILEKQKQNFAGAEALLHRELDYTQFNKAKIFLEYISSQLAHSEYGRIIFPEDLDANPPYLHMIYNDSIQKYLIQKGFKIRTVLANPLSNSNSYYTTELSL